MACIELAQCSLNSRKSTTVLRCITHSQSQVNIRPASWIKVVGVLVFHDSENEDETQDRAENSNYIINVISVTHLTPKFIIKELNEDVDVKTIKRTAIDYIATNLGGCTLAAEFLLSSLITQP